MTWATVTMPDGKEVIPVVGAQVLTCRTCKHERIFVTYDQAAGGVWFKGTCGHLHWVDV